MEGVMGGLAEALGLPETRRVHANVRVAGAVSGSNPRWFRFG